MLMRRGDLVPGWEQQGVDLLALIEQAPGGIGQNVLAFRSGDRVSIAAYGTTPLPDIPSHWRELERAEPADAENGLLEYYVRFPNAHFAVVTANPIRRVGKAICMRGKATSVLYYLRPGPITEEDDVYRRDFAADARAPADLTFCYTAHRASVNKYSYRYFDEQGYLLPGLNAMSDLYVATIEPRRPLETYVSSRD